MEQQALEEKRAQGTADSFEPAEIGTVIAPPDADVGRADPDATTSPQE